MVLLIHNNVLNMKLLLLILLFSIQALPEQYYSLDEYEEKLRQVDSAYDSTYRALRNLQSIPAITSDSSPFNVQYRLKKQPIKPRKEKRAIQLFSLIWLGVIALLVYLANRLLIPKNSNQKSIEKSILHLFQKIPANELKQFQMYSPNFSSSWADPIIETQHIAKSIARQYQLNVNTISVSFDDNLKAGGTVELHNGYDFFIEINRKYIENPIKIIAILAHEIAHIYLQKRDIRFEDSHENEILTDTTAAFIGFGYALLKSYNTEVTRVGNVTKTEKLGYLNCRELAYITALSNAYYGREVSPWDMYTHAGRPGGSSKREVAVGHKLFYKRLKRVPLDKATHKQRALYKRLILELQATQKIKRIRKRDYTLRKEQDIRIEFKCPLCEKNIRIPALGKKLKVSCPRCQFVLPCET